MTPLEQWLSDATRGLSAESATRVHEEIQQHYDAGREAGDDALAALGNPRTANRAYRKVLLTEQQARMAPVLTQPKRPSLQAMLGSTALLGTFLWLLSRKHHGPGFWPFTIAFCLNAVPGWFFPPNTVERSRTYGHVLIAVCILLVATAWWYNGWTFAWTLGAGVFVSGFFLNRYRMSIFRKLAAGQTYSLLPEEPILTHSEAMFLRTLRMGGEPAENAAVVVLFLLVGGLVVWLPTTYLPMAIWITAGHLTRRAVPFSTEQGSRWFRVAKWSAMALAALLPVLYKAPGPWIGAAELAFLFVLFDMKSISLRRKLPVAEWPRRLYW